MKRAVRRGMVMLALALALPGCMADVVRPGARNPAPMQGCAARGWRCLGDPQLFGLIERTLAQAPWSPSARASLSAAIARRYIAWRLWQTRLVLLAAREEIDGRSLAAARQCGGALPCRQVAGAEARLRDTRADLARTRAEIAAQRDGLAVLTGSAPGVLDGLPGGPIPLPPAGLVAPGPAECQIAGARAPDRYDAARLAAGQAQAAATDARAGAARQAMRARAGTSPPEETLAADRHALDALLAEQQARAAMTLGYLFPPRNGEGDHP